MVAWLPPGQERPLEDMVYYDTFDNAKFQEWRTTNNITYNFRERTLKAQVEVEQ